MREQDLAGIPQSIERWKVAELLKSLGFTEWENVYLLHIGPRRIQVGVYATDESGHRYAEDNEIAKHEISIPFVGEWMKPLCASKRDLARGDGATPICDLAAGHDGEHRTGEFRWSNLSGLAAAGVLCEIWRHETVGGSKARMVCDKFEGHVGDHRFDRNTGRVLGDVPQA